MPIGPDQKQAGIKKVPRQTMFPLAQNQARDPRHESGSSFEFDFKISGFREEHSSPL